MHLDRIDVEILTILQNDARIANKQLAKRVGLAPSTCLVRVRRLIDSGVIRSFGAEVDPKAFGAGLEALVAVSLARHRRREVEAFIQGVMALPEVVSVMHVAGPTDFLVRVMVRDGDHLRDLMLDSFTTRPEVARFETSLVYLEHRKPLVPLG